MSAPIPPTSAPLTVSDSGSGNPPGASITYDESTGEVSVAAEGQDQGFLENLKEFGEILFTEGPGAALDFLKENPQFAKQLAVVGGAAIGYASGKNLDSALKGGLAGYVVADTFFPDDGGSSHSQSQDVDLS